MLQVRVGVRPHAVSPLPSQIPALSIAASSLISSATLTSSKQTEAQACVILRLGQLFQVLRLAYFTPLQAVLRQLGPPPFGSYSIHPHSSFGPLEREVWRFATSREFGGDAGRAKDRVRDRRVNTVEGKGL